jgi:hypothetical protein
MEFYDKEKIKNDNIENFKAQELKFKQFNKQNFESYVITALNKKLQK